MKGDRLRLLVGTAGAVLCLGFYFVKSVQLPRRTAVGVETRLFGRGNVDLRLRDSPDGKRWVVVPGDRPPLTGRPGTLESFRSTAREWRWPTRADIPRRLQLFRPAGTWWLGDSGLTRAWRLPALGWLDDHTLWTKAGGQYSSGGEAALDLKTGRTAKGVGLIPDELLWRTDESTGEAYLYDQIWTDEPDADAVGESALEEVNPEFGDQARVYQRDGETVRLVFSHWTKGKSRALYAVLEEETPRVLRITENAEPLAFSKDGRTLFFTRNTALWKVEFRKPLPELLAEVPYPTLPDFPAPLP